MQQEGRKKRFLSTQDLIALSIVGLGAYSLHNFQKEEARKITQSNFGEEHKRLNEILQPEVADQILKAQYSQYPLPNPKRKKIHDAISTQTPPGWLGRLGLKSSKFADYEFQPLTRDKALVQALAKTNDTYLANLAADYVMEYAERGAF